MPLSVNAPDTGEQVSDTDLVTAIRGGDDAAFRELYTRYAGMVFGIALRFTGRNTHDAEELVQETFTEANRCIASFDTSGSLSSWLKGIATHKAIDWQRQAGRSKRGRKMTFSLDALGVDLASPQPGHTAVDNQELAGHLLERIPVHLALAVRLAVYEGLNNDEIARTLGVTRETIEGRRQLALKKLRELGQRMAI